LVWRRSAADYVSDDPLQRGSSNPLLCKYIIYLGKAHFDIPPLNMFLCFSWPFFVNQPLVDINWGWIQPPTNYCSMKGTKLGSSSQVLCSLLRRKGLMLQEFWRGLYSAKFLLKEAKVMKENFQTQSVSFPEIGNIMCK
jgi:hypothetical protein